MNVAIATARGLICLSAIGLAVMVHAEDNSRRTTPTRPSSIKIPSETTNVRPEASLTSGEVGDSEEEPKRIGPYKALTFDREVLQEVVYRESDNTVWLRLHPEQRHKEIVVKISNQKFANYRKWFTTDDYELVSPANAGKQPNALTDWLSTQARFIEYYMDGELFLHLERVEF